MQKINQGMDSSALEGKTFTLKDDARLIQDILRAVIEIVKHLGSPQAMRRMNAHRYYVKPEKVELVIDEMHAICSEIELRKEKKTSSRSLLHSE